MEPTAKAGEAAANVASGGGLDIPTIIENFGTLIYVVIAILAIWGTYNAIMIYRTMAKRSLPPQEAEGLVQRVREFLLAKNDAKAALDACLDPTHWHSALAQLMAVGLKNRHKGLTRVKQLLVMDFHTEVLSTMENRLASIGTASRMGPLLGLLGTVISMIAAFARMSAGSRPDPGALAGAISLGLWTTAAGLILATPLMTVANDIQARLRKLRDRTERQLQDYIEILEQAEANAAARGSRSTARAGASR